MQALGSFRELLDGLIARQVERPNFDNTKSLSTIFDRLLSCFAFRRVTYGKDDLCSPKPDNVPSSFESEAVLLSVTIAK